ncbi:flagellin [Cytobacillus oceanisediminis]|uniref:flagellin N-terminal helical domain-containing protein n=1 Tax=Cytobacillus oceanisediminis TaxID=665099 RepID=UPI001D15647E|nr:flagellin [Cytobacillus oceanisediminis]MCC3648566.1 flagellin [Cytobacillus oceanisediminis]
MRINHNIAALNTYRQLNSAAAGQSKSMEKLSSGLRINKAGDDAAGLAISEKMRAQVRGLDQASRNAQDGISLIQTAEGALNETHSILQRMRELAVQSSNDTNKDLEDREAIQDEVNQLAKEITRIADTTQFNGKPLMKDGNNFSGKLLIGANGAQTLDVQFSVMDANQLGVSGGTAIPASATEVATVAGTADNFTAGDVTVSNYKQSSDLEIKVTVADAATGTANVKITKDGKEYTATGVVTDKGDGAAGSKFTLSSTTTGLEDVFKAGESIDIAISADVADADQVNIKVKGQVQGTDGINVSTQADAESAIAVIDNAITTVSDERSKMGAWSNRLEHTINNLNTSSENLTAAESRIRDVDMAKEMMNQTKNSILSQAAQAMLAQANQQPQGVLQLLR